MTRPRPISSARRNSDLAMIHMAAKHLFGDVTRGGDGRDDYEIWLMRHTGKRSAGDLNAAERIGLIRMLRRDGLIPDRKRPGTGRTAAGEDRPTRAQWNRIGGLSRQIGWNGLEDPALQVFVRRTAKVANARFMTRGQASKVIMGLEAWLRQMHGVPEGGHDAMS